jgi:site-specific recombinase XerC
MPRFDKLHPAPCLYWRHGAYYYVKRNKWQRVGATLDEALAAYARLVQPKQAGRLPALIRSVLADHMRTLAPNTRKSYEQAQEILCRKLQHFHPEQLRSKHVVQLRQSLSDTPAMAMNCQKVLRIVCAALVEQQVIDTNPCAGVKTFKARERGRYITDDELARICQHASPRLRVVIDLCYFTAQRISDVLAIRRDAIGPDGITFTQQKTSARLLVQWSPGLRAAVAAADALQTGSIRTLTLLTSRTRRAPHYDAVHQEWQRACAAAGVEDVRLHDLRAKSLTDAKQQGQDATALAGHADPRMTARYIRLRETPTVVGPKRKM